MWGPRPSRKAEIPKEADSTWAAAGLRNSCLLPLRARDQVLGRVAPSKREEAGYTENEVEFLSQVSSLVAMAVENALVRGELRRLKDNSGKEKVCLENEIGKLNG